MATRSVRLAEPVLICPAPVATARSAMNVSSVSPERCEMIDWYLRFPAGGSTKIAYDPVNPNRVILAEDLQTSYAGALVIFGYAAWLLLFGLPLVLISRHLRKQAQIALDRDVELAPALS